MIQSTAWKWNDIHEERWSRPAHDMYYFAYFWKKEGRQRILDLGCGIGRHSIFFAEEGFQVDAMDLSAEGIARVEAVAKERNLPITTTVGDMVSLPFAADSFDALIAFHSIYHTDRNGIERVMAEIHRVLKPGGEVFMTLNSKNNPSFTNPTNKIIDAHTIVKTEGVEAGIPHYYVDEAEVRRLVAGFELIRLHEVQELTDAHHSFHYYVHGMKRR